MKVSNRIAGVTSYDKEYRILKLLLEKITQVDGLFRRLDSIKVEPSYNSILSIFYISRILSINYR